MLVGDAPKAANIDTPATNLREHIGIGSKRTVRKKPEFDASATFLLDAIGRLGHRNNHRVVFGIVIAEFQNEFSRLSAREA